jgi:hypothetical protein
MIGSTSLSSEYVFARDFVPELIYLIRVPDVRAG